MKPGRKDTGVVRRPLADWQNVHQGIYPAYISWEQFLKNQEQLRQNTVRFDRTFKSWRTLQERECALAGTGHLRRLRLSHDGCIHSLSTLFLSGNGQAPGCTGL